MPSPVFISATQPKWRAAPPISWTSKWRWPIDPLGGLARDGERLDGDVVEVGAVGEALAELGGLGLQLLVGQALELGLEGVDVGHHALERLELLALAGAEDAIEDAHAGFEPTACPGRRLAARPARRPGDNDQGAVRI